MLCQSHRLSAFAASLVFAGLAFSSTSPANADDGSSDRVLRHAVFFSFKPTSSGAEVANVAAAFESLPSKIDAITGFQWGVSNSSGQRSDGFTHAFLLSFDNEAGRALYLPHPEHKEFGNVLRPHMKDVFVIDYWGDPESATKTSGLTKVLKHAVFFKFKPEVTQEQIDAMETAFAKLPSQIDAIKHYEWGANNSPEKHDDGFTHCLMVTFADEAGLKTYGPHRAHEAYAKQLRPMLDQVRVIDFVTKN